MSIGIWTLLGVFAVTVVADIPIAFGLGIAAVAYLMIFDAAPVMVAAHRMVAGIDSFALLAIPLFLLAGLLMGSCGLTRRVVRFCAAAVGDTKGGLAAVTVLACMLFGALSGSAVADVVAIGSILLPALREAGYERGFSCALLGCAGSLATVIPPSITMIVYGITTESSIGQLFVGGIVPGVMCGFALMGAAVWQSRRRGWMGGKPFSWPELRGAVWEGVPAFVAPVIVVGGIRFGFFTPTEAGGIAVAYALALGLAYRTLSWPAVWRDITAAAETTGAILILIATASLFGWILAAEQVPLKITRLLVDLTSNKHVVLLLLVGFLLVIGTFMETISIILILGPVLVPVMKQFGIDPVHFGIVLTLSLAIGANTPPIGIDLMAACRIEGITMMDALGPVSVFVIAMTAVTLVITFVPGLVYLLQ